MFFILLGLSLVANLHAGPPTSDAPGDDNISQIPEFFDPFDVNADCEDGLEASGLSERLRRHSDSVLQLTNMISKITDVIDLHKRAHEKHEVGHASRRRSGRVFQAIANHIHQLTTTIELIKGFIQPGSRDFRVAHDLLNVINLSVEPMSEFSEAMIGDSSDPDELEVRKRNKIFDTLKTLERIFQHAHVMTLRFYRTLPDLVPEAVTLSDAGREVEAVFPRGAVDVDALTSTDQGLKVTLDKVAIVSSLANVRKNAEEAFKKAELPGELDLRVSMSVARFDTFPNLETRVDTEAQTADRYLIFATPEDGNRFLRISLTDNSGGVPLEMVEHLLKPGVSSKGHSRSGTGLRSIALDVEGLKGMIHISTDLKQKSTTIEIFLPIQAPTTAEEAPTAIPTGTRSIIIIDDTPSQSRMFNLLLTRILSADPEHEKLFKVQTYQNRSNAIADIRSHVIAPPIIIIGDEMMPEHDGVDVSFKHIIDFAKEIDVPFVRFSGGTGRVEPIDGIAFELEKPLSLNKIAVRCGPILEKVGFKMPAELKDQYAAQFAAEEAKK